MYVMPMLAAVLGILLLAAAVQSVEGAIPSPREQMDSGVLPENVQCREGLMPVIRHSGEAACLTEAAAEMLDLEVRARAPVQVPPGHAHAGEPTPTHPDAHDIKRISSLEDLEDLLESSLMLEAVSSDMMRMAGPAVMASSAGGSGGGSAGMMFDEAPEARIPDPDHSTTNIQTAGVDEPDYVKNDAKYVYIVSGNTLSIIDAYPAEDAELILKIALDIGQYNHIQDMFLNDDRLVLFYNGQNDAETIPMYDFAPRRQYNPVTHALVIDVSDRESPVILKDYSIDGHFRDARMIGSHAYFVTNSHIDYHHPRLPVILEDSAPVMTPDAFYFDSSEPFSNFNTLTAIDIFGDAIDSETFLMGYSGTFYVSRDSFYLAYQQGVPLSVDLLRERFFDVIVPLLPGDVWGEILEIREDSAARPSTQWMRISDLLQESYNTMDGDDRDELFDRIGDALDEYDSKVRQETERTIIHRVSIGGGSIEYAAKGSVPGRLLNQFSMDQDGDRFRVATTGEYHAHDGAVRASAVHVLDEQLDTVGSLGDIAPGESIFSARFIDDRLYLVTFEQIDPFFVIDLSDDTPRILGELKIPGFSNYLHPYDGDHIIGIGRDTKVTDGRVQQLGVKLALFDVADVKNPRVFDDVVIGDGSTYSAALDDHKSFFFDRTRGVVSVPIYGDAERLDEVPGTGSSEFDHWSGFYAFSLDDVGGFDIMGTVTHSVVEPRFYDAGSPRTFHIGDVLYTVSDAYLKMNSIETLGEINSVGLDGTGTFIDYLGG